MNNLLAAHCGIALALILGGCSKPGSESPDNAAQTPPPITADRLFVGTNILTMDDEYPHANAVAIEGDMIVWVGDVADWKGIAAEQIELGRRALLPGFIDAHGHLTFLARTVDQVNVASPPVGPVVTIASLQEVVRTYIRERGIPAGEWVVGTGYDDSLIEEQRHPDRDDLDAISDAHPIALVHVSGHLSAVNSLALQRAGITADTADPPGGVIRRRPGGREPNGILEETASAPLAGLYTGESALSADNIHKALDTYASHGITTVQEGAASWQNHARLAAVAAGDGLNLDVVTYPVGMDEGFKMRPEYPLGEYRNRLKLGGIKLILDGSPQGKTAYLSRPYEVVPPGLPADYRGYPTIPQTAVNQLVAHYIGEHVPMLVHCNGDAAADMLIRALELADEQTPLGDHRTVMIHAQTVREDQLDRMQQLGILPSYFSAHTFFWGDWHRDSVLGNARASRISPTASTLQRGMRFTVHNDAPVVPPDMIRLLWATVNRITRSGEILGERQRIPPLEAIQAMTADAAYQYFEEDTKGTITPGKQADLVILSENPLDIPPETILEIRVIETISRGRTVYPL